VVLLALFLVNLPFVHETLAERQIARSGREVEATVLEARTVDGRHFVDYRLPRSLDPGRARYSARLELSAYARAKEMRVLAVRVVPGKPSTNHPAGEVRNSLFAVVALSADAVILLGGVLWWLRWRRWSRYEVLAVDGRNVSLASPARTFTAVGPEGWVARVQPGERVSGAVHLVASGDVLPDLPLSGLEQVAGAAYDVRGRVVDARKGRVELGLDDGFRLSVETGGHRIRADIRDSARVSGTLHFTPTVCRA
jgi:hypothetical protein